MSDEKEPTPSPQSLPETESELDSLRRKCAFLERVVHEVPANIYVSDLEKGVIWCNKTNEESLGYSLDEILELGGMAYMNVILHPEDQSVPGESIDYYQHSSGAEFGGVFRAKHKEEETYKWYIGWSKTFSRNEEGTVKELVCVDVAMSQQMNTEEQLVQALKDNLRLKNMLLIQNLRKREIEVLSLICKGFSTKAIATKLFISSNTVSTHRRNIQKKLGTANVAELVSLAREAGLG